MNCPNCGNEINENQKFCTNCGYVVGNNSNLPWINQHYKEVIISSVVLFFLVICSALALNNNNNTPAQTKETVVEDTEIANDGGYENPDDMGYGDELEESQKPTNLPRNCIYETKDGVCFTTKTFYPEPLNYYDCTGGLTTYSKKAYPTEEYQNIGISTCYHHYDAWAGAMKMCSDWGYKLPSDYELTSLAKDVYGVIVSDEINTQSYLPDGHGGNASILEKLGIEISFAPSLWENNEADENHSYERTFTYSYTYRGTKFRTCDSLMDAAICTYNPYGKIKISHEEYERQRIQKLKEKQQRQQQLQQKQQEEQLKKEAENALF